MNIFVSNLNFKVDSDGLKNLFEQYGKVDSAKVITDKMSGRSRGFGFVEMGDDDGQQAIDALNNSEQDGRTIAVNVARPKEQRA